MTLTHDNQPDHAVGRLSGQESTVGHLSGQEREDPVEAARLTVKRAREHLVGLQHSDGWWQGELETNVTMDAEDLMLREFLGIRAEAETAAAGRWIRSQQRA